MEAPPPAEAAVEGEVKRLREQLAVLELRVVGEFEAVELAEAAADELASPTHLDVNI